MPMFSPLTRQTLEGALGYLPGHERRRTPEIDFELTPEMAHFDAVRPARTDEARISAQIDSAFQWCASRFPFSMRMPDGAEDCSITTLCVAQSARSNEYVTASSPNRRQTVFVAAPWPLPAPYRLGSLFVHEAMHQALYLRELDDAQARPRSLAYSPWKTQLRPGRLVWHSFWTFSVQFAFLGEALAGAPAKMLADDPELPDFLAEMDARIACCAGSLVDFDIIERSEETRVRRAMELVDQTAQHLAGVAAGYHARRETYAAQVSDEIEEWSARQLAHVNDGEHAPDPVVRSEA